MPGFRLRQVPRVLGLGHRQGVLLPRPVQLDVPRVDAVQAVLVVAAVPGGGRGCAACPAAVQCAATPVAHLARMRATAPVIRVRGGRALLPVVLYLTTVVPARTSKGTVKSVLWRGRPPPTRPLTVMPMTHQAGGGANSPAPARCGHRQVAA